MNNWENVPKNLGGLVGFVYIITNLHTGKKYVGQKKFWKSVTRKPLKGRVNKRRGVKESDWRSYWGSCKELLDDKKIVGWRHFEKKILILCESKAEMNYAELLYQIKYDVLFRDDFYNNMINIRLGGMNSYAIKRDLETRKRLREILFEEGDKKWVCVKNEH